MIKKIMRRRLHLLLLLCLKTRLQIHVLYWNSEIKPFKLAPRPEFFNKVQTSRAWSRYSFCIYLSRQTGTTVECELSKSNVLASHVVFWPHGKHVSPEPYCYRKCSTVLLPFPCQQRCSFISIKVLHFETSNWQSGEGTDCNIPPTLEARSMPA